jgi:hypothetical protein
MEGLTGQIQIEQACYRGLLGTPLNGTNLLHRHLKPAGWKIGMPWLSTISEMDGRPVRARTADLHRVKVAL